MNAPRHRFHELVTEKYALLHKQYHSKRDHRRLYQLSYLLPLIDDVASKEERKEYVKRNTRVFPILRLTYLIAREYEWRRVS